MLTHDFAEVYKKYCACRPRVFSGIPSYIFSKNGLIINTNFQRKALTKDDFDHIEIIRVHPGRISFCKIRFYKHKKIVARLRYESPYPKELDFLLDNIKLVHDHVSIADRRGYFHL